MSDALVRFRSPRQPAHYVHIGRGYKFVGGRLAVTAEDADLVRAYALANPALEITEGARPRTPRKPKASEDEA
ncbi:MAG TPA: hypothetical protein VLM76_09780 [Patescibacteria group bacterium]|nr:hypothetical protein [Patescibacteria group bacterium]